MGKQFDELAKALATGTSRHVALKRFAAGLAGAALATVGLGRYAEALDVAHAPRECQDLCEGHGLEGRDYGQCVSSCADCFDHGGVSVFLNNGVVVCT